MDFFSLVLCSLCFDGCVFSAGLVSDTSTSTRNSMDWPLPWSFFGLSSDSVVLGNLRLAWTICYRETLIKNTLSFVILFLQSAFVRGHRRAGSDVQFIERTRLDAQKAMNKELQKLIQTGPPGLQEVSLPRGVQCDKGFSCDHYPYPLFSWEHSVIANEVKRKWNTNYKMQITFIIWFYYMHKIKRYM